MKKERKILIVGAGVAGLTIAYLLHRRGEKVVVVEKDKRVGGLAKSFYYGNFTFDIGPHRFHTEDREVLEFIKELLNNRYLTIPRKSGVYIFGKYHNWPLRPSSLFHFPLPVLLKTGLDMFKKQKTKRRNFEEYIISLYGKTIYSLFFEPYTLKFLKKHPKEIHPEWAMASIDRAIIDPRVKMSNLFQLIETTLLPRSVKTEFIYPVKGGIGEFSNSIAMSLEKSGVPILLQTSVREIKVKDGNISSVVLKTGERVNIKSLIWTAPIPVLFSLLKLPNPGLTYLSTLCYNIEVKGTPQNSHQWCYFGESDIPFIRVSIPSNMSPENAPHQMFGLCAEVTCFEGDHQWKNPETMKDTILNGLLQCGLINSLNDVKSIHIENIPNTYPVYGYDFKDRLQAVEVSLEKFKNVYLSGRTGKFFYNNIDHSVRMGMDLANSLIKEE